MSCNFYKFCHLSGFFFIIATLTITVGVAKFHFNVHIYTDINIIYKSNSFSCSLSHFVFFFSVIYTHTKSTSIFPIDSFLQSYVLRLFVNIPIEAFLSSLEHFSPRSVAFISFNVFYSNFIKRFF